MESSVVTLSYSLNPEPLCCSTQHSNCCLLTRREVTQGTDKVVWYSHLFKSFPQKDFLFLGSKITADSDSDQIRSDQLLIVSDSLRPQNRCTPGLPAHHQLLEFTQTHVHRVGDAIQPSHPLPSPSPPAPNPSQHQSLFQ